MAIHWNLLPITVIVLLFIMLDALLFMTIYKHYQYIEKHNQFKQSYYNDGIIMFSVILSFSFPFWIMGILFLFAPPVRQQFWKIARLTTLVNLVYFILLITHSVLKTNAKNALASMVIIMTILTYKVGIILYLLWETFYWYPRYQMGTPSVSNTTVTPSVSNLTPSVSNVTPSVSNKISDFKPGEMNLPPIHKYYRPVTNYPPEPALDYTVYPYTPTSNVHQVGFDFFYHGTDEEDNKDSS